MANDNEAPFETAMTREELLAEHLRGLEMLRDMRIARWADLISPWAFSPQERALRAAQRAQKPGAVVK